MAQSAPTIEERLAAALDAAELKLSEDRIVALLLDRVEHDSSLMSGCWRAYGPKWLLQVARRIKTGVRSSVNVAVRQHVAIVANGQWKHLPSLTRTDLELMAAFREKLGTRMIEQARLLRRTAKAVGERTLGEVWASLKPVDRQEIVSSIAVQTRPEVPALLRGNGP